MLAAFCLAIMQYVIVYGGGCFTLKNWSVERLARVFSDEDPLENRFEFPARIVSDGFAVRMQCQESGWEICDPDQDSLRRYSDHRDFSDDGFKPLTRCDTQLFTFLYDTEVGREQLLSLDIMHDF